MSEVFPGKLAVQQRVLPTYRVLFFETLAGLCRGGLTVFAGQPRPDEAIQSALEIPGASLTPADNQHYLRGPLYMCRQPNILEWLEAEQPDALIVEGNPRYPTTPAAIRWMQARGKPVLGWALGAPPLSGLLAPLRQRARQRLLHSLDGVISYSQRGAAQYRELGLPPKRVFVAYNAAAPRPTQAPPKRPDQFDGPLTLLFVGRLQARKLLEVLFQACAAQPDPQPRLLVVGDGPARQQFENQAQELYPQTEFLGGLFGSDLDAVFAQADLFVLPGTGGLAIQQAMSHGLPAIVAEGDGTQDDLVRPGNGWLVRPGDIDHLSGTLTEALSDVQGLRRMGAESFRIAAEEINLEAMAENFIQAIQSVSPK